MRVQVYYNLHKHKWSVKNKKTGLVIDHCDEIYLENCKFIVRQGGRERVLKEKRKNVHAFVEGDITVEENSPTYLLEVTYNPYKYDQFVVKESKDKTKIFYSSKAVLKNRRVFI